MACVETKFMKADCKVFVDKYNSFIPQLQAYLLFFIVYFIFCFEWLFFVNVLLQYFCM